MSETALITGASAGLGAEFAKLFAADRADLVLVARRQDRLEALARQLSTAHGVRAEVIAADLMDPAGAPHVVAEVQRRGLTVDCLVNNAGFGTSGTFWTLDAARERGLVEVNVTTPVVLTRAFLPGMVERRRGRVLNVGSTAGFQPGPFMADYYASKAFVISFTLGLAYELRGTGVTATVSCPGATATEFPAVAGNEKSRLFKMGAMDAATVAGEAYRAMRAGQDMVVHGVTNKLGAWSAAFAPRRMVTAIAAAMNRSPGPA